MTNKEFIVKKNQKKFLIRDDTNSFKFYGSDLNQLYDKAQKKSLEIIKTNSKHYIFHYIFHLYKAHLHSTTLSLFKLLLKVIFQIFIALIFIYFIFFTLFTNLDSLGSKVVNKLNSISNQSNNELTNQEIKLLNIYKSILIRKKIYKDYLDD